MLIFGVSGEDLPAVDVIPSGGVWHEDPVSFPGFR